MDIGGPSGGRLTGTGRPRDPRPRPDAKASGGSAARRLGPPGRRPIGLRGTPRRLSFRFLGSLRTDLPIPGLPEDGRGWGAPDAWPDRPPERGEGGGGGLEGAMMCQEIKMKFDMRCCHGIRR